MRHFLKGLLFFFGTLFLLGLKVPQEMADGAIAAINAEMAGAQPVTAPGVAAQQPPSAPAPASSATRNEPTPEPATNSKLFYDDTTYVAMGNAFTKQLTVTGSVSLAVIVDIDNTAPVDVLLYAGSLSRSEYEITAAIRSMTPALNILGALMGVDSKDAKHSDEPQSETPEVQLVWRKRGAYRHYESEWLKVPAGDYTLVLDNMGNDTPARDDVPARLRISYRPES